MKLNTQNNPLLAVVLLLVLVGAAAVIVLELRQRSSAPSVALAASPSVASAPPAAAAPPVVGVAREESDRDPFARPPAPPVALPAVQPAAPLPPLLAAPVAPGLRALPLMTLPTPTVAASRLIVAPTAPRKLRGGGDKSAAQAVTADSLRGLRVSAILGDGSRASALVEGGADGPQTVRAGDILGGLRVLSVRETQITLAGANGLRTLPLTDAPEGNGPPVQENAHATP